MFIYHRLSWRKELLYVRIALFKPLTLQVIQLISVKNIPYLYQVKIVDIKC